MVDHVTEKDFQEFTGFVGDNFEQVRKQFEQVDKRFEQVDKRFEHLDKKIDQKFDTVITSLDAVMKEVQAHREEDVFGAQQLCRHDNQLLDHEKRITALEAT